MGKEIIISEEQKSALAAYTGKMFTEIDFQGLEQIINKISESSGELTDGMRAAAIDYAKQWQELVVERLNDKKYKLEKLLEFLTIKRPAYYMIACYGKSSRDYRDGNYCTADPVADSIIRLLSSNDKLKGYGEQLEDFFMDLEDFEKASEETRPDREQYLFEEENMTYNERCVALRQFEYDQAKFSKEYSQKSFTLRKHFCEILEKMSKDKEIVELIKVIKYQLTKSGQAYTVAKEKVALVTMAINFGNSSILSALQELHEFQKSI